MASALRVGGGRLVEQLDRAAPLARVRWRSCRGPRGRRRSPERARWPFRKAAGRARPAARSKRTSARCSNGRRIVRGELQGRLVNLGGFRRPRQLLQADRAVVEPAAILRGGQGGVFEAGGGGFELAQGGIVLAQLAISRGLVGGAFGGIERDPLGAVVQARKAGPGEVLLAVERRPRHQRQPQGRGFLLGAASEQKRGQEQAGRQQRKEAGSGGAFSLAT